MMELCSQISLDQALLHHILTYKPHSLQDKNNKGTSYCIRLLVQVILGLFR